MKQSFSFWSYRNKGLDDLALLKAARKIGFDAVELIDASLYPAARDAGLAIAAAEGHASIGVGFNDPSQHSRIAAEIDRNLAIAVKYGIPNLIVFSGNRRPGQSDDEAAFAIEAGVGKIIKAAEDAGVTLVMELLNSKIDHKGYQCDRTAWLAGIVDRIGSDRFKALYDIYHMQIMEGDVIRTIGRHAKQIGHYHTAGVPGRHEIDETQELFYPAIVRAIAGSGYSGYIGHEILPLREPEGSLRHAYELTRDALA